jgi:hypothetical protein
MKTETGTMRVSTPEATALDLLRYVEAAGHLGNVATVLAELAEKIDAGLLAQAAKTEEELTTAQRLGHVLDHVGGSEAAGYLAAWIEERRPRFVPLRPDRSVKRARKDDRWRLLVNEKIEAET